MWHTSLGICKLQGAESLLLRASAVSLYEHFEYCGGHDPIGAPSFDELSVDEQRLAILAVTRRLYDVAYSSTLLVSAAYESEVELRPWGLGPRPVAVTP